MVDLNRATILGRVTRDPEVRTTTTGQTVTTLGVATNRSWTDQSGVKQERVEFHNCVLWGKLGEITAQYVTKGRKIYIEGRMQTRDWTGQDGVKRYRTEVVAENMIMLDGPRGNAGAPAPESQNASYQQPDESEEIKVEDIPF